MAALDLARFRREPSRRTALLWLIGLTVVSTAFRAAMAARVQTATVFPDEMGYAKLAQSIGLSGRLALFNEPGLSYSPLYPALMSPIYALGASAPTAYELIKIVNAFLMSLAVFPTYKIARFALPRRFSLLVAGLSVLTPLMIYSSLTVSENLAYPLCLVALWAMLNAVQTPSARSDALLLVSIALATAARIQLIVLIPAALTAVVLGALFVRRDGSSQGASVVRAMREHWLLFGAVFAVLLVSGAAALAQLDVLSIFGRYAIVLRRSPDVSHFLAVLVQHVAGVDLAVGVVPFVAALVAAYAFLRCRRPDRAAFAAVSASVTAWLLLEVAYDAAVFDSPGGDLPRIHERFLIYVTPLFLTVLVAAYRSTAPQRVYVVAAAVTALLPAAVPFTTVVNYTVGYESFALHPFARIEDGYTSAVPHATLAAIWAAGTLALLYVFVRGRLRAIVVLALLPFIVISTFAQGRIQATSVRSRSFLPAHADWVDRAAPGGEVVLIAGDGDSTAEYQAAYNNLSIARIYYACGIFLGTEFGERAATVDDSGVLLGDDGQALTARYVVAPDELEIRGRVLARNRAGRDVLVAPLDGRVTMPPAKNAELDC